jgi:polysaccharide pyruvyl transferase WcaK-like protein
MSLHHTRYIASSQSLAIAESVKREKEFFRTITLLDTAVASTNLGDQIIMEAVRAELADVLSGQMVFTVVSHEWMGAQSRKLIRHSDWTISGGTNLLSSRMWFRPIWKVTPIDGFFHLNVILMGAGWYQYQHAPDPYSRWLLKNLLSRDCLHSVRDSYALKRLASIGITNTVNTGCPTIWKLTLEHCGNLPKKKAPDCVTALNSYNGLKNPAADRRLLQILQQRYNRIYMWVQTHTDCEYARSLDANVTFLSPSVTALDAILTSELSIDYVGNRLHAGIRALQKGRRAVILEIDNRAREMGHDFGLPTVERTNLGRLEQMIEEPFETSIRPPSKEIALWKSQFRQP